MWWAGLITANDHELSEWSIRPTSLVIRRAGRGACMKLWTGSDPRLMRDGGLGGGGMGRVYLGLAPAGRSVAIKVVRPSLASDSDFLRLFQVDFAWQKA